MIIKNYIDILMKIFKIMVDINKCKTCKYFEGGFDNYGTYWAFCKLKYFKNCQKITETECHYKSTFKYWIKKII